MSDENDNDSSNSTKWKVNYLFATLGTISTLVIVGVGAYLGKCVVELSGEMRAINVRLEQIGVTNSEIKVDMAKIEARQQSEIDTRWRRSDMQHWINEFRETNKGKDIHIPTIAD